ncbi:MAG: prepilin peptidase [Clostridiales bacterium]|jgi:leader peptidase (prepilin peptidase)/N-methyltransferase|nr:prepilin peptidase [Clostridiales bacterium]
MIVVYIMSGFLGLCVGSFLNVVIYRLPEGMSLAFPASHCPFCKAKIKWYDNIPVLSYIFLLGKCRNCKAKISLRYPAVEVLNAVLWLLCVNAFWEENYRYAVVAALAVSVLICITFIDIRTLEIPDVLLWLFGACGVGLFLIGDIKNWPNHLITFGSVLVLFAVFYFAGKVLFKREAMGTGDIIIACSSAIMLGFSEVLLSLVVASVVGCVAILIVKFIRKDGKNTEYPFAPFLALGTVTALLYGKTIIDLYLSLFDRV